MTYLTFDNDPHRQQHFDFFNAMDQPHFSICAQVDVTALLHTIRTQQLRFTPTVVYLLSRAANELAPFRWRIRGQQIVEHERVHPSFTVRSQASTVFSFCTVPYQPDRAAFSAAALATMEQMQTAPTLSEPPGQDEYLFLSSFPFVHFTGLTHAMHYHPADSVPRITWGKYLAHGARMLMPLSVQVHHAVVDGSDVGNYYQRVQEYFDSTRVWL